MLVSIKSRLGTDIEVQDSDCGTLGKVNRLSLLRIPVNTIKSSVCQIERCFSISATVLCARPRCSCRSMLILSTRHRNKAIKLCEFVNPRGRKHEQGFLDWSFFISTAKHRGEPTRRSNQTLLGEVHKVSENGGDRNVENPILEYGCLSRQPAPLRQNNVPCPHHVCKRLCTSWGRRNHRVCVEGTSWPWARRLLDVSIVGCFALSEFQFAANACRDVLQVWGRVWHFEDYKRKLPPEITAMASDVGS